ncbi:hypothetical protein [Sanguibacter suaedae]|uniref:Uncharacterized protein n=1 Tax=Sanguibacter suaedae TaxID=2795737 RepID=A0A934I5J7_9MICO|nr:hypothetical protein [Sanguibacter suaedae]MBI9115593.1 hypothetical protein [Sanguibacter suaedae]
MNLHAPEYSVLAQSMRLLNLEPSDVAPEAPESLPPAAQPAPVGLIDLAAATDDDLAATAFGYRGPDEGESTVDVWLLLRDRGGWRALGGGSSIGDLSDLARLPEEDLGGHLVPGMSGEGLYGRRRFGRLRRSAGYKLIRASLDVEAVKVITTLGRMKIRTRVVPVPANGYLLHVWHGDEPMFEPVLIPGGTAQHPSPEDALL